MKSNLTSQILSQEELFKARGGNDEPIRVPDNIVLLPPPTVE